MNITTRPPLANRGKAAGFSGTKETANNYKFSLKKANNSKKGKQQIGSRRNDTASSAPQLLHDPSESHLVRLALTYSAYSSVFLRCPFLPVDQSQELPAKPSHHPSPRVLAQPSIRRRRRDPAINNGRAASVLSLGGVSAPSPVPARASPRLPDRCAAGRHVVTARC
jgi:hypothetical protein